MELDFKEAIGLMKQGKEEGFNKLYFATYNKVYFRAKECTKTESDAQDLVQITYLEAYKNIDKLQAPEATLSWLYTICYNQACKMYRSERDKKEFLLTEESEGIFDTIESVDVSTMPELSVDQKATADIVRAIIDELPELQRMTVIAFYFDGMKIEQIAETMDCSVNTVKSRLNYARKYIKDKVEEKQKKEGYRLYAFSIPTLFFAIRLLAQDIKMDEKVATEIYAKCCGQLGFANAKLGPNLENVKAGVAKLSSAKIGAIVGAFVITGGAIAGIAAMSGGVNRPISAPSSSIEEVSSIEIMEGHVDLETIAASFAISADAWKDPIGSCYIDDADGDGVPEHYQLVAKNNPLSNVQVVTFKEDSEIELCVFDSAYLKHLWGHKNENRITYTSDYKNGEQLVRRILTLDLSSHDNEPEVIMSYDISSHSDETERYTPSEDMYEILPLEDISKEGILKYIQENILNK